MRHLVRGHQTLRPGPGGVVRAGVAGGRGLGDGGQRGHGAGGNVRVTSGEMFPIRPGHQGRVGVRRVVMERGPWIAGEPVGSEVWGHPRVWRHPRVHPDPLHHGLAALAELWPEAVRGRAPVGHHVAVILLARVPGVRPALLKVFVSQRRYPATGHKLGPVGAGPDPHVVGEGEAGRQRGVGEALHDAVGRRCGLLAGAESIHASFFRPSSSSVVQAFSCKSHLMSY